MDNVSNKIGDVGFEVLTAEVMNTAIFWDMAPCSLYVNRLFGGKCHLHLQDRKSTVQETNVQQVTKLKLSRLPDAP
jgi:hypothetical protein